MNSKVLCGGTAVSFLRSAIVLIAPIWAVMPSIGTSQHTEFRGVTLEYDSSMPVTFLEESVLNLRQVGVNYVALDIVTSLPNRFSEIPDHVFESELQQLRPAVETLHAHGLSVFLRPQIRLASGGSTQHIAPADAVAWFQHYQSGLTRIAEFAAESGVAMVSVGRNLNALESEEFAWQWEALIANMRQRYDGKLTYTAAVVDNDDVGGGFRDVDWWGQLDVIGLDAHVPLTFDFNAEYEDLVAGAEGWADEIEFWYEDAELDSRVVLTNVGYRAEDGGAVFPTERAGDFVDLTEQSLAFSAILSSFAGRDWWDGAFWDGWQADPSAGGFGDSGFTPQHKPAESVLADHYGGQPTFVVRPITLEDWQAGTNGWRLPDSPPSSSGQIRLVDAEGDANVALQLTVNGGSDLQAAKIWTLAGSEAYSLFQYAAERADQYRLAADIMIDADVIPEERQTQIVFSLADDRGRDVLVTLPVEFSGDEGHVVEVSTPLSAFGDLKSTSLFYELELGTDSSWSGSLLLDNLRLASVVAGDVTNDTVVDCDDIDALSSAIRLADVNASRAGSVANFDLNSDGRLDLTDRQAWFGLRGITAGDADLDGRVEFGDFLTLSSHFSTHGHWCQGDFTGDRFVDFSDFLLLSQNFGTNSVAAVPEPALGAATAIFFFGLPGVLRNRRRRRF